MSRGQNHGNEIIAHGWLLGTWDPLEMQPSIGHAEREAEGCSATEARAPRPHLATH